MTQIKICGITNLDDALAAADFGAAYLGFNFYPPSPRSITVERCREITSVLSARDPQLKLVGVFVNLSVEKVRSTLDCCGLDLAQLHGDEPPEMLALLNGRAFKAFRGVENARVDQYCPAGSPPAGLLDAKVTGFFGGTGVTADWQAARSVAARYPIFLAGGLNPENVAQAIWLVRPWGVDTASGVEIIPGKKDPARLKTFIEQVHQADQNQPFDQISRFFQE